MHESFTSIGVDGNIEFKMYRFTHSIWASFMRIYLGCPADNKSYQILRVRAMTDDEQRSLAATTCRAFSLADSKWGQKNGLFYLLPSFAVSIFSCGCLWSRIRFLCLVRL